MQLFRHVDSLRHALNQARANGQRIGFVPTMGNLHNGHIALVEQAKSRCDVAVASIFVNPLQFGLNEDWDQYPRTFEADQAKLTAAGCDYLFFPEEKEIYPNGMAEQTKVTVPTMTEVLCGASRPGHFELNAVAEKIQHGGKDFHALENEAKATIIEAGFRVDYFQVCASDTLAPAGVDDSRLTVLGAMYTQAARLIDNVSLVL